MAVATSSKINGNAVRPVKPVEPGKAGKVNKTVREAPQKNDAGASVVKRPDASGDKRATPTAQATAAAPREPVLATAPSSKLTPRRPTSNNNESNAADSLSRQEASDKKFEARAAANDSRLPQINPYGVNKPLDTKAQPSNTNITVPAVKPSAPLPLTPARSDSLKNRMGDGLLHLGGTPLLKTPISSLNLNQIDPLAQFAAKTVAPVDKQAPIQPIRAAAKVAVDGALKGGGDVLAGAVTGAALFGQDLVNFATLGIRAVDAVKKRGNDIKGVASEIKATAVSSVRQPLNPVQQASALATRTFLYGLVPSVGKRKTLGTKTVAPRQVPGRNPSLPGTAPEPRKRVDLSGPDAIDVKAVTISTSVQSQRPSTSNSSTALTVASPANPTTKISPALVIDVPARKEAVSLTNPLNSGESPPKALTGPSLQPLNRTRNLTSVPVASPAQPSIDLPFSQKAIAAAQPQSLTPSISGNNQARSPVGTIPVAPRSHNLTTPSTDLSSTTPAQAQAAAPSAQATLVPSNVQATLNTAPGSPAALLEASSSRNTSKDPLAKQPAATRSASDLNRLTPEEAQKIVLTAQQKTNHMKETLNIRSQTKRSPVLAQMQNDSPAEGPNVPPNKVDAKSSSAPQKKSEGEKGNTTPPEAEMPQNTGPGDSQEQPSKRPFRPDSFRSNPNGQPLVNPNAPPAVLQRVPFGQNNQSFPAEIQTLPSPSTGKLEPTKASEIPTQINDGSQAKKSVSPDTQARARLSNFQGNESPAQKLPYSGLVNNIPQGTATRRFPPALPPAKTPAGLLSAAQTDSAYSKAVNNSLPPPLTLEQFARARYNQSDIAKAGVPLALRKYTRDTIVQPRAVVPRGWNSMTDVQKEEYERKLKPLIEEFGKKMNFTPVEVRDIAAISEKYNVTPVFRPSNPAALNFPDGYNWDKPQVTGIKKLELVKAKSIKELDSILDPQLKRVISDNKSRGMMSNLLPSEPQGYVGLVIPDEKIVEEYKIKNPDKVTAVEKAVFRREREWEKTIKAVKESQASGQYPMLFLEGMHKLEGFEKMTSPERKKLLSGMEGRLLYAKRHPDDEAKPLIPDNDLYGILGPDGKYLRLEDELHSKVTHEFDTSRVRTKHKDVLTWDIKIEDPKKATKGEMAIIAANVAAKTNMSLAGSRDARKINEWLGKKVFETEDVGAIYSDGTSTVGEAPGNFYD
jgi:hypothetical protein